MYRWGILILAWFVAFNLRTVLLAVSPVLPLIQEGLSISYAQSGLLFSLPVLMMGLFSIPGGIIIGKMGTKLSVTTSLILLFVGSIARYFSFNYSVILLFTCLLGIGIGIAQPALIQLVKDWFPEKSGTATGVYSSGFSIGQAAATLLTGTIVIAWAGNGSWREAFLYWSVPILFALFLWCIFAKNKPSKKAGEMKLEQKKSKTAKLKFSVKDFGPTGIIVVLYFMFQSTIFYSIITWLPTYFFEFLKWELSVSSLPLGVITLIMIPSGILFPSISDKVQRRKPFLLSSAVMFLIGMIGLIEIPNTAQIVWLFLIGISLSIFFVFSLTLPVDIASGKNVRFLSGTMLSIGYIGAFFGPLFAGYLQDLTNHFNVVLWFMFLLGIIVMLLSILIPETHPQKSKSIRVQEETIRSERL